MIKIEPYQSSDLAAIKTFVQAIQEHERTTVPELKSGAEIGDEYTKTLLENVAQNNGIILMSKSNGQAVGFICAWISEDDDLLLRNEFRLNAYISDIYVDKEYRRQGIASRLLKLIETIMSERQCKYIRICSKATNLMSLKCYEAIGYKPYEIIFSKSIH